MYSYNLLVELTCLVLFVNLSTRDKGCTKILLDVFLYIK
jgi:hypothetical protein